MSEQQANSEITPTPEQIEERRQLGITFYTSQLELLRLEAEYERLIAEIEESKVRTIKATHSLISFQMQQEEFRKKAQQEEIKKTDKSGQQTAKRTLHVNKD